MLKIQNGAIKTLAQAIDAAKNKKTVKQPPPVNSAELIRFNRALRDAFGVLPKPQNAPAPQPKTSKISGDTSPSSAIKKTRESVKARAEEAKKAAIALEKNKAIADARWEKEEAQRKAAEEQARREKEEAQRKTAEEQARREKEEKERLRKIRKENQALLVFLEKERQKKIKDGSNQETSSSTTKQEAIKTDPILKNTSQQENDENLSLDLKILLSKLRAKKEEFTKKISPLPNAITPLEQKLLTLESKVAMVKNSELATVVGQEKKIETHVLNEKNKLTQNIDLEQEKIIKQNIWQIEDKRKQIEKQRWAIEDRINEIEADAENIKKEIAEKNAQLNSIKQVVKKISQQEKLVEFVLEKTKLEEDILKVIEEKEKIKPDLSKILGKKNELQAKLSEIARKESSAGTAINAIEEKEREATNPAQKRDIEQSRWQASEELKSIVQLKWENQEKLKNVNRQTEILNEKFKIFDAKIEKIQNNITAKETPLRKEGMPIIKIRDAIRKLFEENNVRINQDVLNDIIQNSEEISPAAKPSIQNKTINPKEEQGSSANKAGKTLDGQSQKKDEEKETNDSPHPIAKKEITTGKTEDQKSTEVPTAANQENATEKTQEAPNKETAGKPAAQKSEDKSDIQIKPPQEKADTEMKKRDSQNNISPAAKEAQEENKTEPKEEKTRNPVATFYREKIDGAPATHIRTFSRENIPAAPIDNQTKAKEAVATPKVPVTDKIKANEKIPQNNLEPRENPKNQNWQNRWNQVKKETIPVKPPVNQNTEESSVKIKPKAGGNKFLARIIVILILAGILGIIMVVILSKNNESIVVKKTDKSEETKPSDRTKEEQPKKDTEKASPLSFISTITIYTEDSNNVPNSIYPYLKKDFGTNGYYELSLQNRQTNTKIGLKQFFDIYKINAPSIFYAALSNDFTVFLYSNNGQNRIGFLTEIINSNLLETALSGWEQSVAQDTDNFFKLLGRKTQTASTPEFNDIAATSGTSYRLMEFTPIQDNFALAWANYKQKYFIFSTSDNSITKIFDQLPK